MNSKDNRPVGQMPAEAGHAVRVEPIYTGKWATGEVRFFRSQEPGKRFPCPCVDDIIAASGISRQSRRSARQVLKDVDAPLVTISTTGGLARTLTLTAANSFVSALVELRKIKPNREVEFATMGFTAFEAMLPDMSDRDHMLYAMEAHKNERGDASTGFMGGRP